MKEDRFKRLQKSMQQGLAHARGEESRARMRELEIAEAKPISALQIKKLRKKLSMSQATFANFLNVSDKTVKAWEQDVNKPSGVALRMLQFIGKDPAAFLRHGEEIGIVKFG